MGHEMEIVLKFIPKKWIIIIIGGPVLAIGFLFIGVLVVIIGGGQKGDRGVPVTGEIANVSAEVLKWEPTVRKYARQFEVEPYVPLMLSLMQQESGGRGNDPMQASEGAFNTLYPKSPNSITDPDYSIWCGVQEFKAAITRAGVMNPSDIDRIKTSLQSYNFGPGFFDYVQEKGGTYTKELAISFSQMMYQKLRDTGIYRCVRPEMVPLGACYGDPLYVDAVLKYYTPGSMAGGGGKNGVKVVDVGKQWIGQSIYVFGGGRTQADIDAGRFDCSSFVHWAFAQAGIHLGPLGGVTTDTIKYLGTPVSPNDMQPGDVIFFDTYKIDGHVAIYMGDQKFIGCQTGKGVAIEDLTQSYWAKTFNGRVKRM